MVPHEYVDVPGLHMLVRPHHGMVPHGDHAPGLVGGLIHTRQHPHIGAVRTAPGVPLLLIDYKRTGKALGRGVVRIIHLYRRSSKWRDGAGVSDGAQEVGPTRPHLGSTPGAQWRPW